MTKRGMNSIQLIVCQLSQRPRFIITAKANITKPRWKQCCGGSKLKLLQIESPKLNLHYTRGITPKRVTSGGAHFAGLAPGQHSYHKTSQRLGGVSDTVSDVTGLGIESKSFRANSNVFSDYDDGSVVLKLVARKFRKTSLFLA